MGISTELDGYRAIAFKTGGRVHLRSRNDNDFGIRYPTVVHALAKLPNETVIDGDLVAPEEDDRPSFSALQNSTSTTPVLYYVFDVMILAGRDVRSETLEVRKALLEQKVVPKLAEPVRYSAGFKVGLRNLIHSVRARLRERR